MRLIVDDGLDDSQASALQLCNDDDDGIILETLLFNLNNFVPSNSTNPRPSLGPFVAHLNPCVTTLSFNDIFLQGLSLLPIKVSENFGRAPILDVT